MSLNRIGRLFIIAALWTSVSIVNIWEQIIFFLKKYFTTQGFQDFDVLKFELKQLSDVPAIINAKMFRAAHGVYKFNVTGDIKTDDLSVYDVLKVYHRKISFAQRIRFLIFRLRRQFFVVYSEIISSSLVHSNYQENHCAMHWIKNIVNG